MPLPGVYGVAGVHYNSDESRRFVNVLYYVPSAQPADPAVSAAALATAVQGVVNEPFKDWLAVTSGFQGVQVSLHFNGQVFTGADFTNSGPGTAASDETPDYVAAVIRKRTLVPGKNGRGRWYIGGVPEMKTATNRLAGTGVFDLNAIAAAFMQQVNAGGVLWSPRHLSPQLDTLVPIVQTQVVLALGTQRRRRVRQ